MTPLREIVKALKEISEWPWEPDSDLGFILSGNLGIAHVGGVEVEASTELSDGERKTYISNQHLIASSPRWLAEMVVRLVESEQYQRSSEGYVKEYALELALQKHDITPEDFAWLKGKVG